MSRKLLPLGGLVREYKLKHSNPEADVILSEATNKLKELSVM